MPNQIPKAFKDLFRPARYKIFYGGRGSTKSWTFATVLLTMAASRPLRILCAREIQISIADSVKRLFDDRIDAMGIRDFYTSTNTEIVGANGSAFIFAGLKHATLTETVRTYQDYLPSVFPLPHPSPRNGPWLKRHSWFDEDVIPALRNVVASTLRVSAA